MLRSGLLLAEDLKRFIDILRCCDRRIVKVTCNDKLPSRRFLIDAFGGTSNLSCNRGNRRRSLPGSGRLGCAEEIESSVGCSPFLPTEIFTVNVLGKLGFLGGKGVEVGEQSVRDEVSANDFSVVHELAAKGVDVSDGTKAPFAGYEEVIVSLDAKDDRVEESLCGYHISEFVEFRRVEVLALAIWCDLDRVDVDEFHTGI